MIHPGDLISDEAQEYLRRFMAYEEWLTDGKPSGGPPVFELPPEHKQLIAECPEGFEFYRHSTRLYLDQALGTNPWSVPMREEMQRLANMDPDGWAYLLEVVGNPGRFFHQRDNALQMLRAIKDHSDARARTRSVLAAYCALYESTLPLWLMAVMAKAQKTGSVDAEYFGGPATATAHGSILKTVEDLIGDGGAVIPFAGCFDTDLRHAVQHNDYTFVERHDGMIVHDRRSGRDWDADAVERLFVGIQLLHDAVILGLQLSLHVDPLIHDRSLRSSGIVGTVGWPDDETLHIAVYQLWCFQQLDPKGEWLDEGRFVVSSGGLRVEDGDRTAVIEGAVVGPLRAAMESGRRVVMHRVPVAPNLGRGLPTIDWPDGYSHEIIGEPDDHVVVVDPE